MRALRRTTIALFVVLSTMVLSAQTVVDPRFVEFNPSPDHNAQAPDGTPLLQNYTLFIFPQGSGAVFDTINIGKPTPVNGLITVDFLPLMHVTPAPGVVYEARVTSDGPGGSNASALSNTFSWAPPCSPTTSPAGQTFLAAGGTGNVSVAAGVGCAWSAVSNAPWIQLTGATGGSGNGTVPFSVQSYCGYAAAAGRPQSRGPDVNGDAERRGARDHQSDKPYGRCRRRPWIDGRHHSRGLSWSAQSNVPWITLGTAGGAGNGTVAFNVHSHQLPAADRDADDSG